MYFFRNYKNAIKVTLLYVIVMLGLIGGLYILGYNMGIGTDEFVLAMYFVLAEFFVVTGAYNFWYRRTNRAIADELFNDKMIKIAQSTSIGPMIVSLILSGGIVAAAIVGASMGLIFANLDNMVFIAVAVSAEAIIGNILLILFFYPAVCFAGPGRIVGQF